MYTETELREALQLSAARADELIAETHPVDGTVPARRPREMREFPDSHRRTGRHRDWLPATAAAAVVAALGAAVFVASGTGSGSKHDSAASPGVSAASHPPATGSLTRTHAHATVALNNLITVRETDGNGYQFGPAGGPQVRTVGGAIAVTIIALPASTPFDPATQITDAQRLPVAGTTGYYGRVSAYLGDPTGDASKYGLPKTTLAWRAANGTWIFIQGENHDVNLSLPTLMTRYQQLGITATPAPLPRLPYRARWLPDGLAVTSLDWSPDLPDVTLTSGTKSIEINLFHGSITGGSRVSAYGNTPSADPHATRDTGDTHLSVSVHGYPQATAQKILDNLTLSKLPSDNRTWWTVTEAFNS
ncbi:MAG: hypothetical protein DLM61_07030 [Pseudonocardiales bacterium]|nr:MAG: hypothetical protein DLM61_07030 [Pseudonocardiales bacterium]